MTYQDGVIESLVQPELRLSLVTDIVGENFLYLSGQEPDYRWETITADLLDVVQRFHVDEVITFSAMPAAIPHTRQADMLMRSTKLKDGVKYVHGRAVHPGALTDLFEYYAAKQEVSVTNIRVRVPFYLAQLGEPFLAGALAAIRMTANLGGPRLPLGDLEQHEDRVNSAYRELLEKSPDLAELITALENEYDVNPSEQAFATTTDELLQVPSVDEIGLAAEKFLAAHGGNSLAGVIEPAGDDAHSKQKRWRGGKLFGRDFPLLGAKRSEEPVSSEADQNQQHDGRVKETGDSNPAEKKTEIQKNLRQALRRSCG
ncbi:PAC2 family protein [Arcanobacterium hippocoleae]